MSSDSIINTAIVAPTRRRIPLNAKRLAVGAVVGASTLLVLGGTAIAQTVDAPASVEPSTLRTLSARTLRFSSSGLLASSLLVGRSCSVATATCCRASITA